MMPPNLNDPAQFEAYRRELRGVARPLRMAGFFFALLGLALAVARAVWVPTLPSLIPLAAIVLGLFNMVAAVALRTRYHKARMKGEP